MSKINDGYIDINNFTNVKLCDIIVSSRYLGTMSELAVNCMKELSNRRQQGDDFDYELYISEISKKLPDFKIDLKKKMHLGFDLSVLKNIK